MPTLNFLTHRGAYTMSLHSPDKMRWTRFERFWLKCVHLRFRLWGFIHKKANNDGSGKWIPIPKNNWRRFFWEK